MVIVALISGGFGCAAFVYKVAIIISMPVQASHREDGLNRSRDVIVEKL